MDIGIISRITLKPFVHFYDDFFIFCVLKLILSSIKAFAIYNKWYQSFRLKIVGRAKDYEAHKMKIKRILVQGVVDYSLIKM